MRHAGIAAVAALTVAVAALVFFRAPQMDATLTGEPVDSPQPDELAGVAVSAGGASDPALPSSTQAPPPKQSFHGSVAAAPAHRTVNREQVPHGAMERAMLSGGSLNEAATEALQSENFDRLLTQFETEQRGITAELTTAYRAEFEKLLEPVDAPRQIDRFVCGTDVCIASIRSPTRDWYRAWFESVQGRSALPMNALTGHAVDLGGSGVEYRLLFSTSEAVKGFTGSAPPKT